VLLAASGVILYSRLHQAPLQVTGVVISQEVRTTCGVDLTGEISTNGSPGTLSYQWLFEPGTQPPQPRNQSVVAGQHGVYVTAALNGAGHGSTTQVATLQVLGPNPHDAVARVALKC
jgi:hypothetical protein